MGLDKCGQDLNKTGQIAGINRAPLCHILPASAFRFADDTTKPGCVGAVLRGRFGMEIVGGTRPDHLRKL
jgi:hypothetical protein